MALSAIQARYACDQFSPTVSTREISTEMSASEPSRATTQLLIMSTPSAAMVSLSGPMEAPSKVTGSMGRPVGWECSEHQAMRKRSMKASGRWTDRPT